MKKTILCLMVVLALSVNMVAFAGAADEYKVYDYDKYEAKDMGGRVIRFLSHFEDFRFVDSNDEEPDPSSTNYLSELAMYQSMRRVEEKYNVKFERIVVPFDEKLDMLAQGLIGGAPICDIIDIDPNQVMTPVITNAILPVSEYLPSNSDALNEGIFINLTDSLLGDVYYFYNVDRTLAGEKINIGGAFLGYNRDLLNSIGAEDPMELYKQGNWTYDKFLEICKLATRSTAGDGNIDQFGLSGWISQIAIGLIAANDGVLIDSDTLEQKFDSPKTLKALEFFEKLYVTDKVVNVFDNNVWDWNGNINAFKEGKTAFFAVYAWMLPEGADRPNFNLGAVPFPAGPDNTSGATHFCGLVSDTAKAIPRGVEDPQMVYQIYEDLTCPYYTEDTIELLEQENGAFAYIENRVSTEADVDMIAYLSANTGKFDIFTLLGNFPLDVFGPIVSGDSTPAQAVESSKQMMQDFINSATAVK